MMPREYIDMPKAVPSKPRPTIKKTEKTKEKPKKNYRAAMPQFKIDAQLRDPEKRKYFGPCCMTHDGIHGTRRWGDGKPSQYVDGSMYYECTGCRKTLDRPEPDEDGIDWAEIADFEAQHRAEAGAA